MRGMRFVAALALICTVALLAGEPTDQAVPNGDNKDRAEQTIRPQDVIQIEMLKHIHPSRNGL